jgi:hypothetical protein
LLPKVLRLAIQPHAIPEEPTALKAVELEFDNRQITYFSTLHVENVVPRVHPASSAMGTERSFPGGKASGIRS